MDHPRQTRLEVEQLKQTVDTLAQRLAQLEQQVAALLSAAERRES